MSLGVVFNTDQTLQSCLLWGVLLPVPRHSRGPGKCFQLLQFSETKKPPIGSGKWGIHKRADGAFTASKQHGHPKCMPLDLCKHPTHPPSRFAHNTQVKITSSEALQNSQSLVLEAKHTSRKFMAKRKLKLCLSTELTASA